MESKVLLDIIELFELYQADHPNYITTMYDVREILEERLDDLANELYSEVSNEPQEQEKEVK